MNPIKIFISGDFAPRFRVTEAINKGEYPILFGDILPVIKSADYAITNLEAPLTETASPLRKTGPNLIAPSKSVDALKYAGFDMVTLANNHALDQGAEGLCSTINSLDTAGIKHIGAGKNITEAQKVHTVTIKGKKIAFVNCCENEWSTTNGNFPGCNPYDEIGLYYQIKDAKEKAEYVILIIHGGHETYGLPSPRMKKSYRWFIDIGADAVIGHHTHCYSGREEYKSKPIVYSLGNFVFDHRKWRNNWWNVGCAGLLTIENENIDVQIIPFHQCNAVAGIQMFNERETESFEQLDRTKTSTISDDNLLCNEYNKFLASNYKMYEAFIEPYSNFFVLGLKKLHLFKSLLSPYKRLWYYNLIKCESHRDILLNLLRKTSLK